jgi:Acetyltransferase (GNAT) domain
MSVHCETLDSKDIPQACELFARVFGHATEPEHWRWKYQQGPRLAAFNLIARNLQGQIVGHVGASVFPGHTQGQTLPMAQVSDVMVLPESRSAYGQEQGIYPQLMKRLQQEMHARFPRLYTYGFVGIRPYKLGERMGLYRSRQHCRTGHMTEPSQPANLRNGYCQVRPLGWEQALNSELFDATAAQARLQLARPMIERSRDYMRWRYAQHPVHSYQLWTVRQWWQNVGWLVTRCMPNGEHMLIDQWPVPGSSAADPRAQSHLSALLRQLKTSADQPPVLASWSLDTPQARQTEPVIGIEIRIHEWQDQIVSPIFTPGDTDVY